MGKPVQRLFEMLIKKIISGGQTGADQGALDFALQCGIPCGGWCPKGRICEAGLIPDSYPVTEAESDDYNFRTRQNILDSDGTLIIIRDDMKEAGTRLTKTLCEKFGKPFLLIDTGRTGHMKDLREEFTRWISESGIRVLNVAGNRESSSPGIQQETGELLRQLITGA